MGAFRFRNVFFLTLLTGHATDKKHSFAPIKLDPSAISNGLYKSHIHQTMVLDTCRKMLIDFASFVFL